MPKYFIDTEFIEGFKERCISFPFKWKQEHFIDLISIGIVCDDGREYYAISNEFIYDNADKWVKENVISQLVHDWVMSHSGDSRNWALDRLQGKGTKGAAEVVKYEIGKSNKQIKEELILFFGCWRDQLFYRSPSAVQVYGYYSDYDWVLFCSLFGKMIDLPKEFPMYCIDLKQKLDELANKDFSVLDNFENRLSAINKHKDYPKQENEHNALDDAKWNKKLYEFLKTI